ncbi:hypothetical protein [Kribbella sp. NPDC050459]|uniref:hypothetical protein n=1 Tax=Kribbella sp. NPDC050459 TaxID=3155785 RepID=UPI0033CC1AA3
MPYTWTAEDWEKYRNWADEVTVRLTFVTDQTGSEIVEEWTMVPAGSAAWSQDWLVREVESLGHDPDSGEPMYILKVRETKASWGFDAATQQILMEVSAAVLGAAAWEGLRALAKKVAERIRDRGERPTTLSEEEAENRVRWLLSERYKIPDDGLRLKSIETDGVRASAQFIGPDGSTYQVGLELVDGLVTIDRTRRELPK